MFKVIGGQLRKKARGEIAPLAGYAKAMPKVWEEGGGDHVHVSTPEGRSLEVSSGGVQANARSLAKIAGLLANAGVLPEEGKELRLVSEESVYEATGGTKRAAR